MKQDSSREENFNSNLSFQQFSGFLHSQPQQAISAKKRYRLGSHRVHDCKIKMSKKEVIYQKPIISIDQRTVTTTNTTLKYFL